ncbi:hypothetical protein RHSIM_Rhsim05G0219300 [Rhododendron simsii]|uniref:hAT-like transposase RNase-H fold domain-containing protein n=1 Tax=Rhododendron simsii TaxID=118357 RepID=A0A834LJV6_RHOSS|nr:hypothetical protein RHSIM_Rhsim05G0219300 [Rhododendron simsii]
MQLNKWETSEYDFLRLMAKPMSHKFVKYWDESCLALAVSVVLDPRCKMAVVEFYYEQRHMVNSGKYPTLAMMTRDILAVLATIVASEAAFSVGGRVIDESRASLLPDIVEAVMTANDWIESPKKISQVLPNNDVNRGVARPKDDFVIVDEASSRRGGEGRVSFCFGVSVGSADHDNRICI